MASASARPDCAALSAFSSSSAAIVEEYGRLKPIASMTADIVLAVYIPPQEPAPGHARRSTSSSSSAVMRPAQYRPTASHALTTVRSPPLERPPLIAPP